jgi:hypothetical protein
VIEDAGKIESQCMICGGVNKLKKLYRIENELYYNDKEVKGLIGCAQCYDHYEHAERCEGCGEYYYRDEMIYHEEAYWCEDCFNERFMECYVCEEYYWRDDMVIDRDGHWLCLDCASEHRKHCEVCGEWVYPDEVAEYEMLTNLEIITVYVCEDCQTEIKEMKCERCSREFYYSIHDYKWSVKLREIIRLGLCDECYKERLEALWNEAFKNEQQPHLPFDVLDMYLIEL